MKLLPLDEDGDYPPYSIIRSYYAAKCWDAWKMIKHKGASKAQSALEKYHSALFLSV